MGIFGFPPSDSPISRDYSESVLHQKGIGVFHHILDEIQKIEDYLEGRPTNKVNGKTLLKLIEKLVSSFDDLKKNLNSLTAEDSAYTELLLNTQSLYNDHIQPIYLLTYAHDPDQEDLEGIETHLHVAMAEVGGLLANMQQIKQS